MSSASSTVNSLPRSPWLVGDEAAAVVGLAGGEGGLLDVRARLARVLRRGASVQEAGLGGGLVHNQVLALAHHGREGREGLLVLLDHLRWRLLRRLAELLDERRDHAHHLVDHRPHGHAVRLAGPLLAKHHRVPGPNRHVLGEVRDERAGQFVVHVVDEDLARLRPRAAGRAAGRHHQGGARQRRPHAPPVHRLLLVTIPGPGPPPGSGTPRPGPAAPSPVAAPVPPPQRRRPAPGTSAR